MAFESAWGYDGLTYSGKEMRELVYTLSEGREGVSDGGMVVSQQTVAANTVKVSEGGAVIIATGAGEGGSYQVYNDADLTSPAFSPTAANPRIDRLIIRVTAGVPALEIVQGVAAGSPTEPAITGDNYLELAAVTLPASTTNITDAMIDNRQVNFVQQSARGLMFHVTRSAANIGFTTIQDIDPALVGTFTAEAGRKYVAHCRLLISSGTSGVGFIGYLREGGTTISTLCQDTAFGPGDRLFTGAGPFTATAGSHTYKLSVARIAGAGTIDVAGNAVTSEFWIEDVGPA